MVTLDRGLEEALALLSELERRARDDDRGKARVQLAIMAVERARRLLQAHTGEVLYRENW